MKLNFSAFTSKQTNIFSAAFYIILTTILAQVLGWVKYRLFVSFFGASSSLGVFFAAFRIPDFLFQVLIASALASVFIPIFSDYVTKEKQEEAYRFASSLTIIGVAAFIIVSVIVIIFAYPLSGLVTPGFSPSELALMANFTRIILLSEIFFILGTVATGILQSFQHFLIPGIASALYNAGIIIGLVLLMPFLGIYATAVGVVVGAFLFFIIQLPFVLKAGFRFTWIWNIDDGVKKVLRLMVPRSFTILITQISLIANVFFASFISARSLVPLELAQTLMVAPVLLFGQSIAQASFPSLAVKVHNKQEFMAIFVASFNQILYMTLPISVLFIVLRVPLVRLFFGASRFDWQATVSTGMTLAFFSISVGAQSLMYLLARAFYAHKDTQTPFIITLISVVINIILLYVFVLLLRMPVYSIALAFSVANILAAGGMLVYFNKKVTLPKMDLLLSLAKILIATFTMGFALYIPIKLLDQLVFDTTRTINLIILTGISSFFGLLSFVFFTWLLDIREAYYVIAVVRKFNLRNNILKQIGEVFESPMV